MKSNEAMLAMLYNCKLDELRLALRENIREENAKKAGTPANKRSIVNRLVKGATKQAYSGMTKSHEFRFDGCDYIGVTDGTYILASLRVDDPFGLDPAEPHEKIDIQKFFDVERECSVSVNVEEVRAFAKDKANKGKPYVIVDASWKALAFDAKKLADCLDFCEINYIYYNAITSSHLKTPAAVFGANDMAILLPVYIQNVEASLQYMENWRNGTI